MSKIPVLKSGFRSWLLENEGKSSKAVLYEQKYQNHHDRIRNKENMSDDEKKNSSSFVSMVNPQPTAEDYEKYDSDRRLKARARDMRVAQRSASSSDRNSFSMTPEPKELSPTNDQYFTPQRRSSGGLDEVFVTPSTSKKEKRRERETPESSAKTPVSTKPPRYISSDQQAYYTSCLSRKMEDNFCRMQELVFSGHSLHEARQQTITETTMKDDFYSHRSPRRSSRASLDENVLVNRSSSQPPPIGNLNMLPGVSRPRTPTTPDISADKEFPILRTSYVDTLVATHQMQIQYADRVVVGVERQMTKLESMKNLASLSRSPASEEAKRRRMAADAIRKLVETNEQRAKKLEVIQDLKERVEKITNVQMAIHQLVSNQPFEKDPYNQRLLNSLDGWASLPFHEFDNQTAREKQVLHRKMMATIGQFKNVASMHRKSQNLNRSLNTSRKSIAMKIAPSRSSNYDSSSDFSHFQSNSKTREAATQVTARLAETAMTQTSPRKVGVEPLDFSSLSKTNTSSQTTPTVSESVIKASNSTPIQAAPTFSMNVPTSTVADIDAMLNGIVLHNESLETIDSFSHFKTDISYPLLPAATSEHSTPRSERVSLDSESARRLSAGVSQFLEQIKKENESFERIGVAENNNVASLPIIAPSLDINASIHEDNTETTNPDQTSPTREESESELNVDDHDTTQFEHDMEEQEEQRRLRETAMTPTPPVAQEREKTPQEFRPTVSLIDLEDEHDETKKFDNNDEFERSLEEEQISAGGVEFNESADDSGFLLDNKPAPRLKSIFDNVSTTLTSSSGLQTDTPRLSSQLDESTFVGMDMEEYCQKDFLNEMGPIMIKKAIEFQNELRGLDWISAQDVWKPPSFEEIHMDYYDHFDYFDSYSVIIWGAVVDLINRNYLKFNRKMTRKEEMSFEKEALEMLQNEHGPESKKQEWCREVKLSKKLNGMMPFELDYRYDVRRGLADTEKQKYQWQQVQMVVIAERYPRKKLIEEINKIYDTEKVMLAHVVIDAESEQEVSPNHNNEIRQSENVVEEEVVTVSDV